MPLSNRKVKQSTIWTSQIYNWDCPDPNCKNLNEVECEPKSGDILYCEDCGQSFKVINDVPVENDHNVQHIFPKDKKI